VPAQNYEEYAARTWPILCRCAAEGSVITYGDLGDQIGLHPRQIGRVLSVIQDYCLERRMPPLTILIVNKRTGEPGAGFRAWDADNIENGMEQVYGYPDWLDLPNPFGYAAGGTSQETLARRLVREPDRSEEVYRLVQDRGVAQSIFRRALLEVYDCQCAFCGFSFEDALEAAHIIRWSAASADERLNARNGLLLCSVHHKLFDAGVMTVDIEGVIHFLDPEPGTEYSDVDELMTRELDGEMLIEPARDDHAPNVEALEWRERHSSGEAPAEGNA
jgi:putative restriction endonuclease